MSWKTHFYRMLWRQNWISLRLKKSIHRHLKEQGDAPDAPFRVNFFGLQYEGNLSSGIEFAIYYYGAFEKPLLYFLRDVTRQLRGLSKQPITFCDIGSNIGQHSLFMSSYADEVHAFEPYQPVRQQLEKHIALNNLTNINVHEVGLGATNKMLEFFAPTGSNQGIGSFSPDSLKRGTEAAGQLQVVQGDLYFAEQEIKAAQLIKIDVEGFEKPVLSGLKNFIAAQRPILVCEVTYGESYSFNSLKELAEALPADYSVYQFDKRDADGTVNKRRSSRAKRTGNYQLQEFDHWWGDGQDDLIAIPKELASKLSLKLLNPSVASKNKKA